MSDHILFSRDEFHAADDRVFRMLLRMNISGFFERLAVPVMVTDSTAVRAFTGRCRWMGDIDFLVRHDHPGEVAELMRSFFGEVIVGSRDGFFRLPFNVHIDCTGSITGIRFLVDVHVNSIFHHGCPALTLDQRHFDCVKQVCVYSASRLEALELPVPALDTILEIKGRKAIGNDLIDMFALIGFADLPPHWLSLPIQSCVRELEASLDRVCGAYELIYHDSGTVARQRFLMAIAGMH